MERIFPIKPNRTYIGERSDDTGLHYLNARYYNANQGIFLSIDPMFHTPEKFLLDPQQFNMYGYGRGNPVTNKDPLGLFALSTGTVEKGDTLKNITSTLNKHYGTSYSIETIQNLNGIKDPSKISVGQSIIPNEKVPDITRSLSREMLKNAADPKLNQIKGALYFYEKVDTGGDWDFKNNKSSEYYRYNDKKGHIAIYLKM